LGKAVLLRGYREQPDYNSQPIILPNIFDGKFGKTLLAKFANDFLSAKNADNFYANRRWSRALPP
jgi:hypothetical protein